MICLMLDGLEPFAWVPWGVYIGLPPRVTMVKTGWVRVLAVYLSGAVFFADSWGPPTGGSHRLAWYEDVSPGPPRAGRAGCRLL